MATVDLFDAIRAGDTEAVRKLIEAEPALTNTAGGGGMAPLMIATYMGKTRVIELLLANGATLDVFAAAALGMTDAIQTLLDADPTLVSLYSPDGWTALHLAAHFGQTEAARMLIAHGASTTLRSRNEMDNHPLHAACAGHPSRELIELLLDSGAEVNALQHGGFTPLHEAAQNGDIALAGLLLSRGADAGATTDEGKTALQLAEEAGHADTSDLLRQHGAS